ncbi:hypothetical protein [Cupriavidus sp. D39]|uniref:hypothetical protein n=1 Tax=Cupriavidus sp. D39 TaxID=2997877 RepID=UPI0022719531|nr:hypothetical protein [Cupriavidus sp. D39]MCY0853436.1 hypothetical protein [Cupriavidus sp. D39]
MLRARLCEQGFPHYLAWATILRGWALARQGNGEEGIALIHQGLRAHEATGAALGRPSLLGLLADAYGRAGQIEAGLRVLGDALVLVDVRQARALLENWS